MDRSVIAVLIIAAVAAFGIGAGYVLLNNDSGSDTVDPIAPDEPETPIEPDTPPEEDPVDPDEPDRSDKVGKRITYEVSGRFTEGYFTSYTSTGTQSMTYLYYSSDKDVWFINYHSETTYDYGYRTSTVVNDDNRWGLNDDSEVEEIGEEDIETKYYGTKHCRVIIIRNSDGSWEKQWGDEEETYHIEAGYEYDYVFSRGSYHIEFDLASVEHVDVDVNNTVTVYTDAGITVTGSGTYRIGDYVTVTASGNGFSAWLDENHNWLSSERSYTFQLGGTDVRLIAAGDPTTPYVSQTSVTLDCGVDLVSAEWRIEDQKGNEDVLSGAAPTYSFGSAGYYYITIDGTAADGSAYHGFRYVFVDGFSLKVFQFEYAGESYTLTLNMSLGDYTEYYNKTPYNLRQDYAKNNREADKAFVVVDEYILDIADYFRDLQRTNGWTDVETAGCILAFTQYIEYVSDTVSRGHSEWWKYPVETLYDQNGDCEDTSILCSAIYKAMGYKSALILMYGHMAVGLSTDGMSGKLDCTMYRNGYYFGETTDVIDLGEIPPGTPRFTALVPIDPLSEEERGERT
jgi:hypothetical protein